MQVVHNERDTCMHATGLDDFVLAMSQRQLHMHVCDGGQEPSRGHDEAVLRPEPRMCMRPERRMQWCVHARTSADMYACGAVEMRVRRLGGAVVHGNSIWPAVRAMWRGRGPGCGPAVRHDTEGVVTKCGAANISMRRSSPARDAMVVRCSNSGPVLAARRLGWRRNASSVQSLSAQRHAAQR